MGSTGRKTPIGRCADPWYLGSPGNQSVGSHPRGFRETVTGNRRKFFPCGRGTPSPLVYRSNPSWDPQFYKGGALYRKQFQENPENGEKMVFGPPWRAWSKNGLLMVLGLPKRCAQKVVNQLSKMVPARTWASKNGQKMVPARTWDH